MYIDKGVKWFTGRDHHIDKFKTRIRQEVNKKLGEAEGESLRCEKSLTAERDITEISASHTMNASHVTMTANANIPLDYRTGIWVVRFNTEGQRAP